MSAWGPDRMALDVPTVYGWSAVVAGTRRCGECGREDVDTVRVAFANRMCADCAPAGRAAMERGNWTA